MSYVFIVYLITAISLCPIEIDLDRPYIFFYIIIILKLEINANIIFCVFFIPGSRA